MALEDLKLYGLSYMDHFYEKINVFFCYFENSFTLIFFFF